MKLWSNKMKLFCETSFQNQALKTKNEAFLQDFLPKSSFEDQKNEAFLRDFLQKWHVDQTLGLRITMRWAIFKWMLQKYCACQEKVGPRHTNSCNCHAKWSRKVTFRNMRFATLPRIQCSRPSRPTSQTTKSLRLPCEKHHSRPSSNPPRLPTFLQPSQTPTPATCFATRRNPCACHAKSTFNLQKRPVHLVL